MIRTGVDIVKIEKIENMINLQFQGFTGLFSNEEKIQAENSDHFSQFIAGRFAAKEAIIKCMDNIATTTSFIKKIEILNNKFGKPEVYIDKIKSENIDVSISYEDEYAIAFAVREIK